MQQNIFDMGLKTRMSVNAPLAVRMRPGTLAEFVGQEHILGKGKLLTRLIMADQIASLIFYGPPGTGKTTLAQIIAGHTQAAFFEINAVTAGKKEIVEVLDQAKQNLSLYNRKTILFIDEIHRFNKAQQDALLPSVEKGLITFIGATTENPYFEINSPLLSRSTIFEFKRLREADVVALLRRAISDPDRGYGAMDLKVSDEALLHWTRVSGGDVRKAMNALELGVLTGEKDADGVIHIDLAVAQECIQVKALQYDRQGDNHYDTISAFIKSVRGSDPDGALFWLAKMIAAGEDPKFIARRLVILASEDIGNAAPLGIVVATAAARAVEMIGLPEARINLAQATTYLASCPKSNAVVMGIDEALKAVKKDSNGQVPSHLQDAHYPGHEKLGRGLDYLYPHNYPGNYTPQQYLPDDLVGTTFYCPTENGDEAKLGAYLRQCRAIDAQERRNVNDQE